MQSRYKLFRSERAKSISEYNNKVNNKNRIPYVLIVLDEYADLTNDPASKKEIESRLKRIAQKGRAAGIHIILTTQYPTAEVISSNIRSNLPAQIALRVRSKTESNVILSQSGAETLNGKGDALFNNGHNIDRIQCALVSNK